MAASAIAVAEYIATCGGGIGHSAPTSRPFGPENAAPGEMISPTSTVDNTATSARRWKTGIRRSPRHHGVSSHSVATNTISRKQRNSEPSPASRRRLDAVAITANTARSTR